MRNDSDFDVIIVGAGAAGLTAALRLPADVRTALLAKGSLDSGSTVRAQGGISAVLAADDSLEAHVEDTLSAGAGLCRRDTVRHVVERGPDAIQWLADRGVDFTREGGTYHLTREGGHTHRRVVHAADATGSAIHDSLERQVRARDNITILEDRVAVDLIRAERAGLTGNRCLGLYALNVATGAVETLPARTVVLATGGANKAYLYSSNPDGSTGDGIAMAWRAGCRIADMEFMQFHPTCLFHPRAKSFLISEAVRGEGGRLLLPDGSSFMERFDERGELAPRDVVARAIDHEMKRLGTDHVYLDISHRPAGFIRDHFPTIHERCRAFGFDMTREPLPVVPAAHYTCGGIVTDLAGRTDMPGLYAIGECAHTGLHGANRMASNSLLECLVFGHAAGDHVAETLDGIPRPPPVPTWDESRVTDSDEEVVVAHNWDELRRFMWDYVGIVRTDKRLRRAESRIRLLQAEISEYYGNFRVTGDLIELRNLAQVAELIIRCAMRRRESRGLHYTLDHPGADSTPRNTVIAPARFAGNDRAPAWNGW